MCRYFTRVPTRLLGAILSIAVCCAPLWATAQNGASSEIGLSWPDVVAAVDADPRFVAATRGVDAAKARQRTATEIPNPTARVNLGGAEAKGSSDSGLEWGASLEMPLDWMAQRRTRREEAKAQIGVAQAEAQALRLRVLIELRRLFSAVVRDQASVAAFEELSQSATDLEQVAALRVSKGEARPMESIRAAMERERIEAELDRARTSLAASRAILGAWLGWPKDKPVVVQESLEPPPAPRRSQDLDQQGTHPAVQAAEARQRANLATLNSERRSRAPSLALELRVENEIDKRAYGAGLAVELPLWNFGRGRVAQAEANLAASLEDVKVAQRQVMAETTTAEAACLASAQIAKRLGDRVLPRARQLSATFERSYAIGEASLLEVMDARRALLETEKEHRDAAVKAQEDCAVLHIILSQEPR